MNPSDEGWVPIEQLAAQYEEIAGSRPGGSNEGWVPIDQLAAQYEAVASKQRPSGGGIVRGYNISRYATDPTHEAKVAKWADQATQFVTAKDIDRHIRSIAPSSPITGQMVINASEKYSVDPAVILAIIRQDSTFGTRGKATRTFNPGNVGNDDTGKEVNYGSWDKGVEAVASWLDRHRHGEPPRGPSRGFLGSIGDSISRSAGVVTGALEAPAAFARGGFRARNINPKLFDSLPLHEQVMVALGGGYQSAWDALTKEGDYGARGKEVFRSFFGGAPSDHVPDYAKPTVEFIEDLITDPTIGVGTASHIISTLGTKKAFGTLAEVVPKKMLPELQVAKLPENTLSDLKTATDEISKWESGEKADLRRRLMDILARREDYYKWVTEWGNKKLDEYEMRQRGTWTVSPKETEIQPRQWTQWQSQVPRIAESTSPGPIPSGVAPSAVATGRPLVSPEILPTGPRTGTFAVPEAIPKPVADAIPEEVKSYLIRREIETGPTTRAYQPERIASEGVGTPEIPEAAQRIRQKLWDAQYKKEERYAGLFPEETVADPFLGPRKSEVGAIRLPSWSNTNAGYWQELRKQNPSLEKLSGSIGEIERSIPWMSSKAASIEAFQEKYLDRFVKLAKASKAGYEEARKFASHMDVANIEFQELASSLQAVRKDEQAFREYITALRDITRAKIGKTSEKKPKGVPGAVKDNAGNWVWNTKNPGGVTLKEAEEAKATLENGFAKLYGDSKQLKDAAEAFNQWTRDKILTPLKDSGIISEKAYNAILKDNDFYATFQVLDHMPKDPDKIPLNLPGKEYFSVANQDIVKGLKGTEKKIRDPIESTIEKFLDAKSLIARNKVVSTFVDDVMTNPQSGLHGVMRPVAANPKQFKHYESMGMNPIMESSINNELGTLSRFVDGKVEKYAVPVEIAEAMKGLSPAQAPRALQAINSIFRQTATTLYLPFTISNAMRDGLLAYTSSGAYRTLDIGKYAADWARGLVQGIKHEFGGKSKVVKDYLESGGGMGYVEEMRDVSVAKRQLFEESIKEAGARIVKSPEDLAGLLFVPLKTILKPIEKVSAAVELAPRLAVFERAQKIGATAGDAAMMARNATIDFQRAGTAMRLINQWVPFLNARVQGRLTLVDAARRDWKQTAAKAFLSTVIPGIGTYAWNRANFSEYYDDIPDYIRQNYFTFIYGTDKDKYGKDVPKYFVIPKGDLGQVVFNPIEYTMDAMLKKDKPALLNFVADWLGNVSPLDVVREGEPSLQKAIGSVLPPALKGGIENVMNRSFFTGREIEPGYMKDLPQEMRYKEDTPGTYKWLSENIGWTSPLKWQNAAQSLFAGYGREGLDPSSMLKGLVGRFAKTTGGAKEDRAWDVYSKIEEGYNHTRARADKLFEEGDRQEGLRLLLDWNRELPNKILEMERTGFKDNGGMRRDFTFTPTKIKHLIIPKRMDRTPLERRLSVR